METSNSKQGRANSANERNALQFVSPRGNFPLKRVDDIVANAPAPPMQPLSGGKFPKEYRNSEGPPENPRENFDRREIQGRPGPVNPGDREVFEYPVKTLVQPPPFTSEYNFESKPANLRQCQPPSPKDIRNYRRRWEKPPNDPGPIRAVVNKDRKVVGAIYHPEGNPSGYERAGLQPLDANGRAEVARHTDKKLTGRSTWTQRGPQ
ncbi:hypothetical protein C7999DRAFT_12028 [Corynascus novoguineensis]|uniref:Uncharacterized protein n=1 Tax=Corynascus novoguineensis TaxID=1126955 RepID=A0AAN7CXQ2_9PEZI|nr:hypothetical protein C7999DRAFT_12028 [Corynascus novoguineensis]